MTICRLIQVFFCSLVLSAHAHHFCDRHFEGGTREVTVSTFTWRNRDDPSFLLLYAYKDGSYSIDQCLLPRESFSMMLHVFSGSSLVGLLFVGSAQVYAKMRAAFRPHLKSTWGRANLLSRAKYIGPNVKVIVAVVYLCCVSEGDRGTEVIRF
jgi:hypothetical protein